MINSAALEKVEKTITKDGDLYVFSVDGITPGALQEDDIPGLPAGRYMIVRVDVAVPCRD